MERRLEKVKSELREMMAAKARAVKSGRKEEGKRKGKETFMSEDGGAGVAKVGVNKLPRDDLMAVKSLPVGEMGVRLASIGRGIVPCFIQSGESHDTNLGRQTSHLASISPLRVLRVCQALRTVR